MERYRQNNQLTEVPGSLRRKIEIYADLDHHPSQTLETDEQEKFVETASRIKKQVWLQVRNGYWTSHLINSFPFNWDHLNYVNL